MPCWEVNRTSVNLEAGDFDLLEKALRALGLQVERSGGGLRFRGQAKETGRAKQVGYLDGYVQRGGAMTLYSTGSVAADQANAVRRAYSREVIKATGQRFNWRVTQKNDRQFVAQRRF